MSLDKKIARAVYERDGWKCRNCRNRNGLHPHHVVYQSRGGPDTLDNLLTLCFGCHGAHHAGKLGIVVLEKLPSDLKVRFIWASGWKPS